jgi:hypothetical protein
MRLRKEKVLYDVMLGAGLYLLDSLRDRLGDNVSSFSERARDAAQDIYETASDRTRRAADVIRGEDHRGMSTTVAVLLGIGIGVGAGMLLAPASGEETRSEIAGRVRERFSRDKESSTGTYGA